MNPLLQPKAIGKWSGLKGRALMVLVDQVEAMASYGQSLDTTAWLLESSDLKPSECAIALMSVRRYQALRDLSEHYRPKAEITACGIDEEESQYLPGTPLGELRSMVRAYSQAFLRCSYSDDIILLRLLSGNLDAWASLEFQGAVFGHNVRDDLGAHYREDGQYAAALRLALDKTLGLWPAGRPLNKPLPVTQYAAQLWAAQ